MSKFEAADFATTKPVGKVHHENGRVFATLDWTRTTDPECLPDGTKLYAVLPSLDAVLRAARAVLKARGGA